MNKKVIKVNGYDIEVSNIDKVIFLQNNITQKDLINYYQNIPMSFLLPLYKNRPLSMQRCPNGIRNGCFMQKKIPDYFPSWIDRKVLPKKDGLDLARNG